jgi:hypothetical protein
VEEHVCQSPLGRPDCGTSGFICVGAANGGGHYRFTVLRIVGARHWSSKIALDVSSIYSTRAAEGSVGGEEVGDRAIVWRVLDKYEGK